MRNSVRENTGGSENLPFYAIVLVILTLTIPFALYVTSYIALSTFMYVDYGFHVDSDIIDKEAVRREYPHRWQAVCFYPAGMVETWFRGMDVEITYANGPIHLP